MDFFMIANSPLMVSDFVFYFSLACTILLFKNVKISFILTSVILSVWGFFHDCIVRSYIWQCRKQINVGITK